MLISEVVLAMKPKILFMGTPEFSVPTLKALVDCGHTPLGVVTQPDRPKGRGKKLIPPPVKVHAEKAGIPVYQPERVRDRAFLDLFEMLAPDMVVLVAFGQILPPEIIQGPPLGCLNVHPSLLPKYRGAAPMNWTIIRGEKETGVTIMMMDEGVDTGDILLQEVMAIAAEDTYGDIHDRLSDMGARLLVDAVEQSVAGTMTKTLQNSADATDAPRLGRDAGHIDWTQSAEEIVNLIRGLSPSPGAYSFLREKKLKIFFAVAGKEKTSGEKEPGQVGKFVESGLQVTAGDDHVYLQDVQLEGKRRMFIDAFLRGYAIRPDDVLE